VVWGGDLFGRIYFPRSVFTISSVGTGVVNLLFALVPFVLVSIAVGRPPTLYFPLIIFPIILLAMFSLGLSLIIASLGIRFPDVVEVYNNIILLAWMYLTPIIYPTDILPPWLHSLLKFNPLFHFVNLFRDPIYYGRMFDLPLVVICSLFSIGTLLLGWFIFSRMTDEIAYRS
jgi:ABC-type polysaccharide/polyol phosphate export permease